MYIIVKVVATDSAVTSVHIMISALSLPLAVPGAVALLSAPSLSQHCALFRCHNAGAHRCLTVARFLLCSRVGMQSYKMIHLLIQSKIKCLHVCCDSWPLYATTCWMKDKKNNRRPRDEARTRDPLEVGAFGGIRSRWLGKWELALIAVPLTGRRELG